MAIQVEIEGVSPNTFIDVGERRTVTRTNLINNMARGGFARIVRVIPAVRDEDAPIEAPAASARKIEWQSFLSDQGVKFDSSMTKAKLIELWEHKE